ncbi:CgeB family protein [Paenibacillus xylaniclasticus]|uniref:CgeB family protein n=1 Tax=Paenibacillus xylaniclasticus TaxID=588083 RepID=UPI000FDACF6D|nr:MULTISPECIES: glycosyltransferase [Paenibacillus]GFN31011.1 spore maturation protein [Paenibacillus curdlanolyticus]
MSRNRRESATSAQYWRGASLKRVEAYEAGAAAGYETGYRTGWREGACEAVTRTIGMHVAARCNVRVIYVPQGFQAIDDGIIHALQEAAAELHVVEASRMAEQALLIRPDFVLVLNGLHVFPDDHLTQVDTIRAAGIRTIIWFADDPYVTEDTVMIAPHYDTVLTHEMSTVSLYREIGCTDVHYLPLAVHPLLFRPMPVGRQYQSDVCFIGQAFWNRVAIFDAIAEQLEGLKVFIAGGLWDRLTQYDRLSRFIRHGWLPVEESVAYYNGARIVINLHRTTEAGADNKNTHQYPGLSINPRTYEISACGTLQLTDVRDDLTSYYRPGYELDTYRDAIELGEKIKFYLEHEDARRVIAIRGLARTLRDHTYSSRIDQLMQLLQYRL